MMTLIRLELLRVARDRKFWFWALLGVPVLLPAVLLLLVFAMASSGTVEPTAVRAAVVTTFTDELFLSELSERGVETESLPSKEAISSALANREYSVGLVDVSLNPGQPIRATLLAPTGVKQLPVYEGLEQALLDIAQSRRTALIDELSFDGPSFDVLVEPIVVLEERVPDRLPSGLLQVVTLVWCSMLLFPYLLLTWNGGSRAVTDRLSGYLAPLNASAMAPWKWLIARWVALSSIGAGILVYSAVLFSLYMRAYGTVADMIVAEGVLDNLSEGAALSAQAYLVDAVRIWRETSLLSFTLWLLVGILQLATACSLVIWGSVTAASLAQYRLFELIPFAVVFLLPMMGLGALGTGFGAASWVPGLNTVLTVEHVVTGSLPGVAFFSSAAAVFAVSLLLVSTSLSLATLSLRNERLWAV